MKIMSVVIKIYLQQIYLFNAVLTSFGIHHLKDL